MDLSNNLVFLKLGGSLITEKSKAYTLREESLARLCQEISLARKEKPLALLIGHGAGSFAHLSAKEYQTHKGIIHEHSWEGFVKVQNDAARLNRIVVENLIRKGEKAISIQPSAGCIARKGIIVEWTLKPIQNYLKNGLVPVPYGDVCYDEEKGCSIISTEEILRYLSHRLKPTRIIIAGNTDGVLDKEGNTIPKITPENFSQIKQVLKGSDGLADVTGGMLHKVKKALEMEAVTEIINGLVPQNLYKALAEESQVGTKVYPK